MIETARLVLRPAAMDDLPWLLEHINTAEVMRYLGGEARSEERVRASLEDDVAALGDPAGHRRWTVFARDGGERLGRLGLFHLRSEAAPEALRGQREIGWMFAAHAQGRGYASEAARGVLAHAFGALGLPTVYAQTSESNGPSTRMMHRLGFTARPELGYHDPDYPDADNPTTVWSLDAGDFDG